MAQRRTNIEIDGTREFNALPVRKNKIGVSETRMFDALQRKRKPEPKKQFRDKDISLGFQPQVSQFCTWHTTPSLWIQEHSLLALYIINPPAWC